MSFFSLDSKRFEKFTFNGKFMILCKVGEYEKHKSTLGEKNKSIIYDAYLNNDTFSDVQILIGKEKFVGHKLALSAHSPVFQRMFCHEMKESISNKVEIEEMDPKVFTEVLRFMYAGKVENLNDTAEEILIADDRYEINELKLICEKSLISKIKLENILELLSFAEKHNADYIKKYCFENFVVKDLETFVKLEGYRDFLKSHTTLLAGWFTEI
ncbi:speckle-type POZ protein B-like [Belonocnema kinseyi]|uniref:speckle-type POZ protein B-like n=1 Tax=Belonocnema kinseyi TaxID=2817044 RepID=UPI00143DC5DE|nr:speckle-type POZ protein B-like [Belonocnema kinseyi]